MTPEQALEAIRARIEGENDNEQLLKIGCLSEDSNEDIMRIITFYEGKIF